MIALYHTSIAVMSMPPRCHACLFRARIRASADLCAVHHEWTHTASVFRSPLYFFFFHNIFEMIESVHLIWCQRKRPKTCISGLVGTAS